MLVLERGILGFKYPPFPPTPRMPFLSSFLPISLNLLAFSASG